MPASASTRSAQGRPVAAEPLAYTADETAAALRISRAMVYKLIAAGELRRFHIGRAARIPAADVHRLAGLEGDGPDAAA